MALACIYELRSYLTCFSDFQKISIFFYYSGIFPNSHYFYADALWAFLCWGKFHPQSASLRLRSSFAHLTINQLSTVKICFILEQLL